MKKVRATAVLTGKAAEIWEKLPKKIRGLILAQLLEEAYFLGKLDVFFKLRRAEEQISVNQFSTDQFQAERFPMDQFQAEIQGEREAKRDLKGVFIQEEEEVFTDAESEVKPEAEGKNEAEGKEERKEEEKKGGKGFDFLEELEKRFQVM